MPAFLCSLTCSKPLMPLRLLFAMIFFGVVVSAHADPVDIEIQSRLSAEPVWLRLLHYERPVAMPGAMRSAIHAGDFFLSAQGDTDARAELAATLAAMASEEVTSDQHVRCRFPARVAWLEQQLKQHSDFDLAAHCPALQRWRTEYPVNSISVVLATGYLGNPASYYGHTLIKFNGPTTGSSTQLQNKTLNYGAIDTRGDNPAVYIAKAVLGGYEAGFSEVDFYVHENTYGENEHRDLWDFELDLPARDVAFVTAHAWELMGQRYNYYFFRQNCAYRMAEILQLLPGLEIIPPARPYTIPQSLTQQIGTARYAGAPLLKQVRYFPSRQARFYSRFQSLTPEQRHIMKRMVLEGMDTQTEAFNALPLQARYQLIDSMVDYHQFANEAPQAGQSQHPDYIKALAMRFALPPLAQSEVPHPVTSPDIGRPPSWAQVGIMHASEAGDALSIRIRPAYYDALDGDGSHVRNAALTMGDTQLTVREGQFRLHKLDIVSVESANPGISGLPKDDGVAWKVRFGAEQGKVGCLDCLVARAQADAGMGRQLSTRSFVAAYLGGGIQADRYDQGTLFARASADAIYRFFERVSWKGNIELRQGLERGVQELLIVRSDVRWAWSTLVDLRLSYEGSTGAVDGHVLSLGTGIYW